MCEPPALFPNKMVVQPPDAASRVQITRNDTERFIIQPCAFRPEGTSDHWMASEAGRLTPFSECIDQDTAPDQPLVLLRKKR